MLRRKITIILTVFSFTVFAQQNKNLEAKRISNPPKIDGVLDDAVWQELTAYGDFNMYEPGNEGTISDAYRTEVKMAYDDTGVYVAAAMYDPDASQILSQFSQRDEIFVQADVFTIALNTYNDGINETRFYVTSAGTIGDSSVSLGRQDFSYNVVFNCRVTRDENGWYAEFKIPYNALRFPESDIQDWSVNFYRRLLNKNETHTWNFIENSVGRETQYNGTVSGVSNIKPPVRLTLFPFVQGVASTFDGETETDFSAGLDVKYGLSDSFTLDATLIPDFGQAAFDQVSLNLGPFEQTFGENRQFFTEGVELFRKGRIFFSRRVGNGPTGSLGDLGETESVIDYPGKVNLLNAIKISGRTQDKLGIGFFNAITEKTYATIEDTVTGNQRKVLVEPFANYNILVLDQQFNNNSSISLINTNVTREGHFRDGNVSALVFDVADKGNNFRTSGRVVVSNVNEGNGFKTGLQTELDVFKTKGKWRYRAGHDFANTTLDINDLGLNFRNNFNNFVVGGSYRIFEPTKIFNSYNIGVTVRHRRLYQPDVQTGNNINLNTFFQLKSRFAFGTFNNYNTENDDYFEPRVQGRYVTYDPSIGGGGFVSSDYRKKFAYDINFNWRIWDNDNDQNFKGINVSPRYRFSDNFLLVFSSNYSKSDNNFGWVYNDDSNIFFGQRDITNIENTLTASYNFDPFKAIDLRFRNSWSTADYSDNVFWILNEDGSRSRAEYDLANRDPNTNFNIWNLDLSFRWRFAPGSEATFLYRNQIFNVDDMAQINYSDSLSNLFDQPSQHTVSLRVTYFIDYNNVKNLFRKKTS
ncbi:MAG: DUF5916 domain-containing protein [Gilvibacter sp.]